MATSHLFSLICKPAMWGVVSGVWGCLCLVASSFAEASGAPVRTWSDSITIPTYPWEEDPNPKFWALEGGPRLSTTVHGSIVYPYRMQDHLLRSKQDRTYRAIFLENEYLRITCLPDLGGRIHSVMDKTTGAEMFHLNKVIKPGMIAMRGAWISGGVEWNPGPHGHTVLCLEPVNVRTGQLPDGAAFLEVSSTEQIFRSRCIVRVTLHPGRSYLDEQIRLENPTDGMHPYYFWNCTAFPNKTGTRFIFPMSLGTDHNAREFFRWPIHNGKDLSWLKNYETYSSIFAVKCTHDFFGAYDVDADRGLVQWADHRQLSGKKAWTWGEWEFGRMSEQDLTDDDGPYIEVQSGPLPTQSDYGRLSPHQRVAWQEWWFPAHGLGDGFEYATRDVVVNVIRRREGTEVRMLGTAVFRGATVFVRRGDNVLKQATVDISPAEPTILNLTPNSSESMEIEVRSAEGHVLVSYRSPLEIPSVEPPDPATFRETPDEKKTAEECYRKGEKYDLATDRISARRYYQLALERNPGYTPARRALAILDFESALYQAAIDQLNDVVSRDANDGWAWYYLAASHFRLKNFPDALVASEKAVGAKTPGVPAADLLGRILMVQHRYPEAEQAFRQALEQLPEDPVAMDHLALSLIAQNREQEAADIVRRRMETHATAVLPLWALFHHRPERHKALATEWATMLGDPEFEILEAALALAEVGLNDQAETLVRSTLVEHAAAGRYDFMPYYYLAWFSANRGDRAAMKDWLVEATKHPSPRRFASRAEEVEILQLAIKENPGDGQAQFQLGCLLANLGRVEEAVAAWRKAAELAPDNSITWRNLGLEATTRNDLAAAEKFYRQAIQVRPDDQTLYRDLAEILIASGRRAEAIELLEKMPIGNMRRADIAVMLAQAYLDENRYDDCLRLLENTPHFTNWEGQDIVWRLFNRAHIMRGCQRLDGGDPRSALADFEAALTYPENLGVGRRDKPPEAAAQYWRGRALLALGRHRDARDAWVAGSELPSIPGEQDEYREKCQQALKDLPPVEEDPIFVHGPTYRCFKIERDLVLTGGLDDPLWQAARVAELREPVAGRPGRYRTSARLLYNDRYLYVGFQCEDEFVWGTLNQRDAPIYEEECVEVFLCPTAQPRLYYEINVSPLNTVFDAFILNGRPVGGPRINFTGLKDYTCEGLITRVLVDGKLGQQGAKGWSAEYAIPFQAIVGNQLGTPKPGTRWFFNLFRIDAPDRQKPAFYSWAPTGAIDFHRPWCFGIILFD
ncbi:MAG: carbohydrate-binding family 9-like protein [Thermogutta sp.]